MATANEQAQFQVTGMHCASCARRIETAVAKLPGVTSANVNLPAEEATVQFDPTRQNPQGIIGAIQAVGYDAALKAETEAAETAAQDEAERRFQAARRRLFLAWALTGPL